jgi:hypothetical protein
MSPPCPKFHIVNLDEDDYLLLAEPLLLSRQWNIKGKSVYRGRSDWGRRYWLNGANVVDIFYEHRLYSPSLKFYFKGKTMNIKKADFFNSSLEYWGFVYCGFVYRIPYSLTDENGTLHYLRNIWHLSDEEIIEFIEKNKNFFLDERQPKPQYLNPKSGGL